jgi:AraC family transcriptional regulator, regulatory protein of adaptative response / methylated-DNA-[protein]-cysteine methyltransferase
MDLKIANIDTPLGAMWAVGSDSALYLLEFADHRKLDRKLEQLKSKTKATLVAGTSNAIESIQRELGLYFSGKCTVFTTPCVLLGSAFQNSVWQQLQKIPYGQTCSYGQIAASIAKPTAYRAVAQANGQNLLPIIIPCHRVINSGGKLGGYSGGLERKQWLLNHEKKRSSEQDAVLGGYSGGVERKL